MATATAYLPIPQAATEWAAEYERARPNSSVRFIKPGPSAVRIQIIDPAFKGASADDRLEEVWTDRLASLRADIREDIVQILTDTPDEAEVSAVSSLFADDFAESCEALSGGALAL